MLPNAQEFVVQGGSFNEAQTQHMDHSTTNYQITVNVSPEATPQIVDSTAFLLDRVFIATAKNGNDVVTSEPSGDSRSLSIPSTRNGSVVHEADGLAVTVPEPQRPLGVFPEMERRLTIYTGVDKALKKLKRSINIAFTLTPATTHKSPWSTIVWKVLQFEKMASTRHQINWTSGTGFCRFEELDDELVQPGNPRLVVKPGNKATLEIEGDGEEFTQIPYHPNEIRTVCNTTGSDQHLALCSIDPKKKANQYSPVVDIGAEQLFSCGPPVMLQAYVVASSDYRERKRIDTSTLTRPLFFSADNSTPEPIDISKLSKEVTAFRIYSETSGKIVLERDN